MEPLVDVLAVPSTVATDLTPVLEAMAVLQGQLDSIQQGQMILCGVVLGALVLLVLAVMFK